MTSRGCNNSQAPNICMHIHGVHNSSLYLDIFLLFVSATLTIHHILKRVLAREEEEAKADTTNSEQSFLRSVFFFLSYPCDTNKCFKYKLVASLLKCKFKIHKEKLNFHLQNLLKTFEF